MNDALRGAVQALLSERFGHDVRVSDTRGAAGGCISDARAVTLDDGSTVFLKSNAAPLPGLFEREAEALRDMHAVGEIRVPEPYGTGGGSGGVPPFILMEHIPTGSPGASYQEEAGRRLALFHQASQHERYGYEHDNYIGSTPQPNGWSDDWVEFWREKRLGFQFRLARQNGYGGGDFDRMAERLLERLPELIGEPEEPACLLHGDLWGGNLLCSAEGEPVLIDPAAYYGRREADLGMTRLFGGFTSAFYAAYNEVWPLADGSEERLEIYKLYHLLNHLNLFGSGYRGGCLSVMRRFAG